MVEIAERELLESVTGEEESNWRLTMGFPSPAEIYRQGRLDLNRYLVRHGSATFYARMKGEALVGEGIGDGDLLVIDRVESLHPGHLVVVRVGAEMLVRRLERSGECWRLASPDAEPLWLTPELDWEFWGRVIYSIRRH